MTSTSVDNTVTFQRCLLQFGYLLGIPNRVAVDASIGKSDAKGQVTRHRSEHLIETPARGVSEEEKYLIDVRAVAAGVGLDQSLALGHFEEQRALSPSPPPTHAD